MKYFSNFPKLKYTFKETSLEMMDIFLRPEAKVKYSPSTFGQFTIYIEDGMSPDDAAGDLYGNDDYFWFVLMYNNIIDIYKQWPRSYVYWAEEMSIIYPDDTFYTSELINVQRGDIIAKKSTSTIGNTEFDILNSGVIVNIDPFLKSFDVSTLNGSINQNDEFVIMRKNGRSYDNILNSTGGKYHLLQKKESKLNSVSRFYIRNENQNQINISPYSDVTTKKYENVSITDPVDGSNTILESYFNDELPSDVTFDTFLQIEWKKWAMMKNIKTIGISDLDILDNAYIKFVLGED